jgi:hypothetical protein
MCSLGFLPDADVDVGEDEDGSWLVGDEVGLW